MTELEQRIIAFVEHETGTKSRWIELSSCLQHDLGMDGDDAVEFFEKFEKDFAVDLALLRHHWPNHFGPEFSSPSLGCLVVIGAAVVLGDLLHRAFQPIPSWGWILVLLVIFGCAYSWLFADRAADTSVKITVSGLVDAATAGRWVKEYDNRE